MASWLAGALDFGSRGLGSSPGQERFVVFLARHFTLTVPLPAHVFKWVPANLVLGGNPAMD